MTDFGFVVHPVDARRDVARKFPIARFLPTPLIEAALTRMKPMRLSTGVTVRSEAGAETSGHFVGCPVTPNMLMRMPESKAYRIIGDAVKEAADLGAEVVGLGAFTAVVGDGGETIALNAPVAVTTGNSYTVATAIEGALRAAELMEIDVSSAKLAVVGATGSIGKTCVQVMAPLFAATALIGRDRARVEEVRELVSKNGACVTVAGDLAEGLRDADVVVTVTSAGTEIIEPSHLKPGAVVCDVARPRDVSWRVARERDDVLVVEGGVVAVPGQVDFGFDFGFPKNTAYACMCETMLLALEGRKESYTVGKTVTVEQVREMSELARKHGFRLAGFRSFEREVPAEEIERIRANARRRRSG
ncbi:MAG: hypothetical protein AMXMBFR61_07530 [Fimbriimonadales bacterium]